VKLSVDPDRKPSRPARSKAARPRFGPLLNLAERAYWEADFEGCLRLLDAASEDGANEKRQARGVAALLRARCARIAGDYDTCQSSASRASLDHPEAAGRMEALALRGLAYRFLGNPVLSKKDFDAVRRGLERDPEATVGWPAYLLALDAWLSEDYDAAAAVARRIVDAGAGMAYAAASLLGWVAMRRERYAEAGACFVDSLDRLRASGLVDRRFAGIGLHAACVVAMETVDPKLARRLEPHVAEMEWPASSAVDRFNFLVSWSTVARLEGDVETAYYRVREAVVLAPDDAYRAIGETMMAVTTGIAGDERMRLFLLRRAWELLRGRRWGSSDDERRMALAYFAYHAAGDLPAEARKAMTLYQSLTAKANVRNVLHRDRRTAGAELMAAARVAEAQGNLDRARRAYEKALEIWQEIHSDMRAAMVAVDLRRLTRDATYDAVVRDVLARAPRAWFGEMLAPAEGPLAHVSRAERLVLAGLLEGKSAKAIAESLDRSVNTINNHTRQIFKAFGVNSRAAVLARCAGLGITPKTLARIA